VSLTAVITDFDYGDNDIERAILEPAGIRVIALQAKSEDELLGVAGGGIRVDPDPHGVVPRIGFGGATHPRPDRPARPPRPTPS
jgi:hypothetical protein